MNPNQGALEELITYLIRNNQAGLKSMLISEGYAQVSTPESMRESVITLIHEQKEAGISKMLQHHPDYGAIVDDYKAAHSASVSVPVPVAETVVKATPIEQAGWQLSLGSMFSMHQQRDYLSMLGFLVLVFFAIKILKD